ncbi:MAG: hypothetical protein EZS26_000988 [Candidatus Ordinivivax streblomastigis]|uniref:Uncharacterized protein n=1 Tax=Candidatus Ordinivivax streblomastigis TaxID=2540710 RepID=A0A5M8P357_9BACT|nr:MAG: hypothetical protein EZS26_000988 [Candidatus Ordinivivax streblomastigis]
METNELELRITEEEGDVLELYIDKEKMPEVYRRKTHELIHSGMTEDEADKHILTIPIVLEIFYDIDRGLFGVESGACESCDIYNPYTGKEIPNDNLPPATLPSPRQVVDRVTGELEDINSELRQAWEGGDFNMTDDERIENARESIDEALGYLHCIGDPEENEEENE